MHFQLFTTLFVHLCVFFNETIPDNLGNSAETEMNGRIEDQISSTLPKERKTLWILEPLFLAF